MHPKATGLLSGRAEISIWVTRMPQLKLRFSFFNFRKLSHNLQTLECAQLVEFSHMLKPT